MARQLSAKLLDQLQNEYKRHIKYRADETSKDHEDIISAINSKRQNQISKAVRDAIESIPEFKGIAVNTKTSTNYDGRVNIEISFKINEIKDPELEAALKKKREHCEMFREKYAELDRWRIESIKAGQVLPIDIPEIPKQEPPKYSCA